MEIKRIDDYADERFSQKALYEHGCFLAEGEPYEVRIISDSEAVITGEKSVNYEAVIEEFRFYAPHIIKFYDGGYGRLIKEYPAKEIFTVNLDKIQPSQFFVDKVKITAVKSFIKKAEDIIIQVQPYGDKYISLDGHTRLFYAASMGWDNVRAVFDSSDDYIYYFVGEAKKRGIFSPKDMILLDHNEYNEKWHRFCDEFFAGQKAGKDS